MICLLDSARPGPAQTDTTPNGTRTHADRASHPALLFRKTLPVIEIVCVCAREGVMSCSFRFDCCNCLAINKWERRLQFRNAVYYVPGMEVLRLHSRRTSSTERNLLNMPWCHSLIIKGIIYPHFNDLEELFSFLYSVCRLLVHWNVI